MADPFAPPTDAPRRRPRSVPVADPAPAYEPAPSAGSGPRDPAQPGLFWVVAAIGVGLVCLGTLLSFFSYVGDLDGEDVAPAVFNVFGSIALSVGLALAAVLQRGLSTGIRTALLLGAGYFAIGGGGFGVLARLSSNPFF